MDTNCCNFKNIKRIRWPTEFEAIKHDSATHSRRPYFTSNCQNRTCADDGRASPDFIGYRLQ